MDIKRIDANTQLKLYETSKKDREVSKSEKNVRHDKTDKISISAAAKNLNILDFSKSKIKYEMSREISDVNIERINALKSQIQNGEYRIDSRDIAAALISGGRYEF